MLSSEASLAKSKSKKLSGSVLPEVGTIGVEELVPKIVSDNPETLKVQNNKLVEANFALNKFNNDLMEKLKTKDDEISHLKSLLMSTTPIISNEGLVPVSPELAMIEL